MRARANVRGVARAGLGTRVWCGFVCARARLRAYMHACVHVLVCMYVRTVMIDTTDGHVKVCRMVMTIFSVLC